MKRILFIIIGIVVCQSAKAQFIDTTKTTHTEEKAIHFIMDPEFPGGPDKMNLWISNNIKYPEQAKKDKIKGNVIVTFIVYEDGSLNDIKIVQSLSKETDEEAIRVVSHMPKWKPGMKDRRLMKYLYTLPVKFK
jgi:TonB family protein